MTRTILLNAFGLLISGGVMAQVPQITSANQIPAIGDTIDYDNANSFGFDEAGSGGVVDVLWDYQTLSSTGAISFWYEDPAGTVEAANFPTATVAMANTVLSNGYEYFETTANSIARLGYTDPANASLYYTPGWDRYQFPLDPGVSNNQTYTGWMTSLGAGEDSVTIAQGNYQSTPDAYGTVVLPPAVFGGTPEYFDDVIRVHTVETFQIILWLFGTPAIIINVTDDYYFWFDEETQEPILIFGTTTDDAGGAPQTVLRYQPVAGTGTVPAGVSVATAQKLSVYPNPTTELVNIEIPEGVTSATVNFSNLIGETILSEKVGAGVNQQQLDVSELPAGIYNVVLSTRNESYTTKLVVR